MAGGKSSEETAAEGDDPRVLSLFRQLYFFLYSSFGVWYPYRALFFASCGYSKAMIGIFTMMPNMASFMVAPLTNSLADQYDVKFEMMGASILGSVGTNLPLLFFGSYEVIAFTLMTFSSAIGSSIGSLVDSMVISNLKQSKDFGKMRQWGAISFGIFSLLAGVSLTTPDGGMAETSQFVWIMLMMTIFSLVAIVIILSVRTLLCAIDDSDSDAVAASANKITTESDRHSLSEDTRESTITKVINLFTSRPIIFVFCFVVFCSGFGAGVIDSFLFIRLEELGGSGTLCGVARFITCMAEVPAFQVAGTLHKRYGTWPLLAFTQAVFVLRFICYATLRNPWWVLPIEILNGVTFAITWSVSCIYADAISPEGTHSTMQALLEAMHFGLGCGTGSLAAGFIYDNSGAVSCFAWSGSLSGLSCGVALLTAGYTARNGGDETSESSGERLRRPSETALNKDVELAGVNSKHGLLLKTEEFEC